jgi:hypothetical protein
MFDQFAEKMSDWEVCQLSEQVREWINAFPSMLWLSAKWTTYHTAKTITKNTAGAATVAKLVKLKTCKNV